MRLLGLRPAVRPPARPLAMPERCGTCSFFDNDPEHLEAAMPGLRSLSSADGSVRSDDGLCALHGRYIGARNACASFRPR